MKIPDCHVHYASNKDHFLCPGCHCSLYRKHGFYIRKGFHTPNHTIVHPIKIPRYLCLNPECTRCTFSILPPDVMRYCRFFWPGLLVLKSALDAGAVLKRLARNVWHVGHKVMVRAAALLDRLCPWVACLHQELTAGKPERRLALMVKIIIKKLEAHESTRDTIITARRAGIPYA